tara:strand:+ start:23380 stop:24678 length:1299 start_codon:yes stop_codon:yes gene_type:complete
MSKEFTKSNDFLKYAEERIPLASQTFSKSKVQMPIGAAPLFFKSANGAMTIDIDDNEYIDFVSSLLCINLGYNYPKVVEAVTEQLKTGTIFSLPGTLEAEVADLLINNIPSAQSVRFGKNGTDVTSAAVRIARAYTKKKIIITCGYHGWQDWYIGTTSKNEGVPEEVSSLTKSFKYNDIESLKEVVTKYNGEIACLIMEPMNTDYPKEGFLEKVREICTQNKIVLIFDEMITGFRFSNGGAQELFNVTPDLSCFGKGIANGYPLSAIVGKKEIMKKMEDVFFSGTFGGELLSLAAAKATINEITSQNVVSKIKDKGQYLIDSLKKLINEEELTDYFEVKGHPSWSFFVIKESSSYDVWTLKTLYIQEMIQSGIYTFGTHNLSYSHTKEHIDILLNAYQKFLALFKSKVLSKESEIEHLLNCKPLQPLFKVRN